MGISKYFKLSTNEINMKIWDGDDIKAVLRVLNDDPKGEMSWINYLSFHFKKLEKEDQIKPKENRIKELVKMRKRSMT